MQKRFRLGRLVFSIMPILMLLTSGCLERVAGLVSSGGDVPILCLDSVVSSRYKTWSKENFKAIEKLKEFAGKNRWRLVVATSDSVKTISLADCSTETIYSTKNQIKYAGLQNGGRLALIERKPHSNSKRAKTFVVVLQDDKELLRIPLNKEPERGCYLGGNPLLVTDNYVVFPDGRKVMMYDIEAAETTLLLETREDTYLFAARKAGDRLYLVTVDTKRDPANSEMLVLSASAPFGLVHKLPNVTNVMTIGNHIILERCGEIAKYSPETRRTEFLWKGTLLAAVDNYKFLFTSSTWKINQLGFLALDFSLREYELLENKSREIAGDFSIDTCYGVSYPVVSPDAQHVIVSDNSGSALVDSEYLVYDIASGEKAGAFYEPYMGKYYFKHIVGWTD